MVKSVVIAEKPSVARDIANVLKCNKKGNGFLEGDKYIVTWALGHLVTLADPEAYDNKYKTWNLEDLPMLPERMKLVVMKQTGKQFNAVKSQLTRNDVNEIIVATDAGREGELVARWIIEKANVKKPLKRLWISSVTDKAIKEGFANLKPGKNYDNLYAAAVARSEADWYIGLNATRALTTRFNAQLNCGRVQTPTVAIIAAREDEIKNFKPQTYYGIEAQTDSLKLTWQDANGNSRSFNKEKTDVIVKALGNQDAKIVSIDRKPKKSFAPGLYDLTELQRDANKLFGYSAKETLNIMQKLYESHKVLTYPRTDSRYLSSDIVGTLPERLKACGIGEYRTLTNKILTKPIKANKSFVDDNKVSDHHAIIPTEGYVNLSAFNDKERKIYDLVVKRFLAVLFPAQEYEQLTVQAQIGNEKFIAKGKTVTNAGWKEVYQNHFDDEESTDDVKEQLLPRLEQGQMLKTKLIAQTSGQTKPPARFTEATLLSAMENPTKYMETNDKKLVDTLKSTGGLGTVATRADIIEKLFNSFLIEKRSGGKEIYITSKGRQLLDLVPEELRSPMTTAEWEQKLELISKGKLKKDVFINEMKKHTKEIVAEIKSSDKKYKHDNISTKSCPDCGKPMLEVNGKKGKMLVCQDRECGHRKNVSRVTNARCPQCKKKLELRGEGDGQIFVCKCGYREKLSAFEARRKKEGGGKVDKRSVQKYMKQQEKEAEPMNNAFADLLKGMKFDE
ncbi:MULTISPECIES: DNA topoisomerase III [unclassified Lysinibacillus]|uniref:DNA topoisomerase III n=1 Tax=unclassified Lysinibacillus TaxID=2636778 RepID=UPI002552B054|nr:MULTISPECIES: DNA topoisomerase III [unclassified Lysinibacillus]MDM5246247.1 DNA topoisomerase III [Lysinibacillus sp. G4S2]